MISSRHHPDKNHGKHGPATALMLLLIAAHGFLLLFGLAEKSPTFDEPAHVSKGLIWSWQGDHRLNTESGLLPSLLARLGLVGSQAELVTPTGALESANIWALAEHIYYRSGNSPQQITYRSRMPMVGLSLLLAWLLWWIARRHYGDPAGAIALALYCFSPTVLANARLANADLLLALTMTGACYAFWRMLRRPGLPTIAACGVVTGLALLSKHSAWMLPIVFGLLVLYFRLRGWTRGRSTLPAAATAFGIALLLVWGAYGFQWSASMDSHNSLYASWELLRSGDSLIVSLAHQANRWRLLPEPVLHGVAYIAHFAPLKPAFINGVHASGGIGWFFPVALAIKTPLATLALLVLAAAAAIKLRPPQDDSGPGLVFAAFCLSYASMAVSGSINLGLRHLLPIYPAVFILAGAAIGQPFARFTSSRGPIVVLVSLLAVETAMAAPHYISFFNRAVGGSQNGYRHLVDSSSDWGQDLPQLARWLQLPELHGQAVFLSYFGTADPAAWQIQARPLPSFLSVSSQRVSTEFEPGYYVISATMLQCVYCGEFSGPWDQRLEANYQELRIGGTTAEGAQSVQLSWARFARLALYLRSREPDRFAAPSLLVYKLTQHDLEQAGVKQDSATQNCCP